MGEWKQDGPVEIEKVSEAELTAAKHDRSLFRFSTRPLDSEP